MTETSIQENELYPTATLDTPFSVSKNDDAKAFDGTTQKGKKDGLFRTCMSSIRSAHFTANKLRAALVLMGVFTDVALYTHSLTMFYVVTRQVENKLFADEEFLATLTPEEICMLEKIKTMQFQFTTGYEKDLQVLYGKLHPNLSWQMCVEKVVRSTPIVQEYQAHIKNMTKASELAGAVFVLWGALIIGGGAMIQPKAKKLVGADAVNVFESIIGPSREARRALFIQTWDSLAENSSLAAHEVQESAKKCMEFNNDMMGKGSKANPWWLKYVILLCFIFTCCILYFIYESWASSASTKSYLALSEL